MAFTHIENLYRSQDILLFRRCFALEKIHGTSTHVSWRDGRVTYSPGSGSHDHFVKLFDEPRLVEKFTALGHASVTVYGELYGGSIQSMGHIYGREQRFIAFDVLVGNKREGGVWLSVPNMVQVCEALGIAVVPWVEVSTDLEALDAQRDAPSVQAWRNGMGEHQPREGVVLRPLIEVVKNNGDRIIAKHKAAAFEERATPPKVIDAAKVQVLADAQAIATEWVNEVRLSHVLDKLPQGLGLAQMRDVIVAMTEDVQREAGPEVVWSKEAATAVGRRTAELFKARLGVEGR